MHNWFWKLINHVDTEHQANQILQDMKNHSVELRDKLQQFTIDFPPNVEKNPKERAQ